MQAEYQINGFETGIEK